MDATSKNIGESGATRLGRDVILYDGVCGLCNRFVRAVIDNDPSGRFHFASLQSSFARDLLQSQGKDATELNTIYLVSGYGSGKITLRRKARAALAIISQLQGPVRFLSIFAILPTFLLDLGYDLVAANRYRIFGKLDTCPLPNPEDKAKFLD